MSSKNSIHTFFLSLLALSLVVRPALAELKDLKAPITFYLALRPQNVDYLEGLVNQISDPNSNLYGNYPQGVDLG